MNTATSKLSVSSENYYTVTGMTMIDMHSNNALVSVAGSIAIFPENFIKIN